MDVLSPEKRSDLMSKIGSKNTKPEILVRKLIHALGMRFRLHRKELPGKPDIVLPKYKTVVFVHGCFWHRHPRCQNTRTPKSRVDFWTEKFEENVRRDRKVQRKLRKIGWRVLVVWECEVADKAKLSRKIIKFMEGSQDAIN